MEPRLFITLLLLCLSESCYGGVLFSSIPRTLVITASPHQGYGGYNITVNWGLNQSIQAAEDLYNEVKVTLSYAPIRQVDRAWRKTEDDLSNDKTCQFKRSYDASSVRNYSFEWTIEKVVPEATYFVRIYAYNCWRTGDVWSNN